MASNSVLIRVHEEKGTHSPYLEIRYRKGDGSNQKVVRTADLRSDIDAAAAIKLVTAVKQVLNGRNTVPHTPQPGRMAVALLTNWSPARILPFLWQNMGRTVHLSYGPLTQSLTLESTEDASAAFKILHDLLVFELREKLVMSASVKASKGGWEWHNHTLCYMKADKA
ncbi:hypothetical protein HN358_01625 [Candidatus Uhrbacteria bacterium]|jgi:hypothetical protein|nr:hypothetical protein [Candidatus Uhrbacteria bacterium]MBT7717737.1 hypothetical protein [Candidatus Uhrbacteria bacterium]